MTRLLSYGSVLIVALMLLLPAAAVAQSPRDERGVLVGVREDLTLDATSSASVVVGVQGNVTVSGHARLVVMVDGNVSLLGASASVDTLVAVRAHVTLGPDTTTGTIRYLDSTITNYIRRPRSRRPPRTCRGRCSRLGGVLGTFLVLLYLGLAVAVLISGAVVAAIGPRQVRRMASNVSSEPLKVLGAGLVGFFVPLILVVLFITVIGIPLGFFVLMTLGLAAFIGFVAMGVWLGDLLLRRGRAPGEGRPIGSALLGLFLLLVSEHHPAGVVLRRLVRARDGHAQLLAGTGWQGGPIPAARRHAGRPRPARANRLGHAGSPGIRTAAARRSAARLGQQPPAGPPPGWGQQPPAGPPPGWGQPPTQRR